MNFCVTQSNKRLAGVYIIKVSGSKRVYIGSTVDFYERYISHKKNLDRQTHANKKLQRAYLKYSPESFNFEILEIVEDISKLLEREQFYIDTWDSINLYNICLKAGSHLGVKRSEETRQKLSKPKSIEHKNNIAIGLKQTYPNLPIGVTYDKTNETYIARVRYNGKRYTLKGHKTPESARNAYLSFIENPELSILEIENKKIVRKTKTSSKYVGITFHKHTGKWVASIRSKGKVIFYKYFETEGEAYEARSKFINERK